MSNKTRKHLWPATLVMSIAIVGVLAAFVVLGANPGSSSAHDNGVALPNHCFDLPNNIAKDIAHAGVSHDCNNPPPEYHASMPTMFGLEGLDNGTRLNWREPRLRARGASVIGYRIERDAWSSDANHPINELGDDTIDLLNLPSVLAVDHSDRGLAYETVYIYQVRAIVEYDESHWWNNLTPEMKNTVAAGGGTYDSLNAAAKAAVNRAYGLQAGKYPVGMVDAWWDDLNCAQMNDAVSPMSGEPAVGSDDASSPYCAMYDDLIPAAVPVVDRAHMNSYNRYALGAWSERRSITTATSNGLLDALVAPPSAPLDVSGTPSCDDKITIIWKEPADNGKVPANFPGCTTCTNQSPIHIGGVNAGIEIQPGTARIVRYIVERKVDNGPWAILDSNVTSLSYEDEDDDSNLSYGSIYHYRVKAVNNADLTGPAGMTMVPLITPVAAQVPTSPDADPNPDDSTQVLFTWDPPGTAAGTARWRTEEDVDLALHNGKKNLSKSMQYEIQRQRIGDDGWETLATQKHQYLPSAVTASEAVQNIQTQRYVDTNVPATGDYRYRVAALLDACDLSEWAVTAEEVTVQLELGDASNLTAVPASVPGVVNLNWTPAPNADHHWLAGIKQSDWDVSDYNDLIWTETQGSSSHVLTGLDSGEEYVFAVIGGESLSGPWSAWSALARVTPN